MASTTTTTNPGVTAGTLAGTPAAGDSTTSGNTFGSTTPTASQATATMMGADPNTSTSNQLNGLIASNSPYLQQAQAGAMQTANDRGLINSTMAAGAGQAAAIAAALPIAQSNAQTAYNTNAANQSAANQVAQTNAQLGTQASTAGAQNQTSLTQTGMNNQTALTQTGMNNQTTLANTALSTQSQQLISQAQLQNQQLITNNQSAATAFTNYQAAVAQIDQNNQMDANAKATAIQNQTNIFNGAIAGLKAATPGVPDVSSLLNFGAAGDGSYTAPDGSIWASQTAYNNAQAQQNAQRLSQTMNGLPA